MSPAALPTAPLRGADHDRGLQFLHADVLALRSPFPGVRRLVCRLPAHADLGPWQRPNLALRVQLGDAFGGISRVYTVRDLDPAQRQFAIDVVLHGHATPMLRWVEQLQPGDGFDFSGPRPHPTVPQAEGRTAVLLFDQTAVPAVGSLLQHWPGAPATLWAACDEAAALDELPEREGVQVHRLPGGTDLAALAREHVDPTRHVVWAAGEREQMRALRRHLQSLAMPRECMAVAAYWKHGDSTTALDERRRQVYARLLAGGGTLEQFDDLDDGI